jgi:hypothetical protein
LWCNALVKRLQVSFHRAGPLALAFVSAFDMMGCSSQDEAQAPWIAADGSVGPDIQADGAGPSEGSPNETASDALGHDVVAEEASWQDATIPEAEALDTTPTGCPADMAMVATTCMDLYEAPNRVGQLPLVMFHFNEAQSWCTSRGKRLCYDDEWTAACAGEQGLAYPYGDSLDPGVCNDDKIWKAYDQTLLNGWPWSLDTDAIESHEALLNAARATGATGKAAADHVQALYQGTSAGTKPGCVGAAGVFDLTGNVEEWTQRRDGGEPSFHGNLKGRFWAEPRTCQQGVKTHGDTFRFYEIGFRCCMDAR